MQASGWERQGRNAPGLLGLPSPGLRPPSPRGRGVRFGTDRTDLSRRFISRPSDPLSLRERVGVRVPGASTRLGRAGKECPRVIGVPSPGLRPPSPKGRGFRFGTDRPDLSRRFISRPSDPLSLRERVGVRVPGASTRLGTAGKECPGLLGLPSPGLRPPSPRGRGARFGTDRTDLSRRFISRPSDPLSLRERVGVRVPGASTRLGRVGKECPRVIGVALTRPSATLSQGERG